MLTFTPRQFKFKAWNKTSRLLMKLSAIDCVRGELKMKDHILLQFTGLVDKNEEEIYEMDIVLVGSNKFVVQWDNSTNGWLLLQVSDLKTTQPFMKDLATKVVRLCSYFESEHNR